MFETLGKALSLRIEGCVLRERDRLSHQLLSCSSRPHDERREFAHPGVKGTAVSAHVVSKNRLPHLLPQLNRRPRVAKDAIEDRTKRAANLRQAGKEMGTPTTGFGVV